MNWVKQNYDRFLLGLMALVLVTCAGLLFARANGFNDVFASLKDQVPRSDKLEVSINQEIVAQQQAKLDKPDGWDARMLEKNRRLPLFVSPPYIEKSEVSSDGQTKATLVDPLTNDPTNKIHPPVDNSWLIDNNQDLLASNVLEQDSDGDGFSTLDEWNGKTNPQSKESHPPYYTKLYLKYLKRIPFRFIFAASNGDKYLINTLDIDAPTQFLKVGDMVKPTKFKLTKYEPKQGMRDGIKRDLSEVTLTNTETGDVVVLPKEQEVDSPTTYAVLTYALTGKDFAVKRDGEFALAPDNNVKYKALELNDTAVKIIKLDEKKEMIIKPRPQGG